MELGINLLNHPVLRKRIIEMFSQDIWESLDIDYHPPRVQRLYCDFMNYRINLHKIYPCKQEEALLHAHPWPSVMEVLPGAHYEMGIGYGEGNNPDTIKIACKVLSNKGFQYEMLDKNGWHYVRPVNGCTYTIMITGKPWGRTSPKSTKKLKKLHIDFQNEILNYFKLNFK